MIAVITNRKLQRLAMVGIIIGAVILATWGWGGCEDAFPLH